MVQTKREFSSDLHQLGPIRAFVRDACQAAWSSHVRDERLDSLILAVDEAATNVILHAYGGEKDRPIELVVDMDADQVCVAIYHTGKEFDPGSVAPPAFDGSRESGFGLYLIQQAVDEVRYVRDDCGRSGILLTQKRTRVSDVGDTMQPTVEQIGDVTVVAVNVEQLDASNAEDLRREMTPLLKDCRKLVLDLNQVQFVDSRGCGAILSCLKHLSAAGGDLKLCQVSPPVRTVFQLIRLNRICEVLDTKEQAVQAFRS